MRCPAAVSRPIAGFLLALGLALWAPVACAQVAGPMLGHVTQRSANLWAQWIGLPASAWPPAAAVELALEYWPQGREDQRRRSTQAVAAPESDGVVRWTLSGLDPGQRYDYRVVWRAGPQQGQGEPASFATEPHWQWRTDPPPLRVLAGSCAYTNETADDRPGPPYGRDPAIYGVMAAQSPDLTLWMGDNIYWREPDFDDEVAMSARYAKWRSLPQLQPLLRTGSHLATWDDHDYGPNDANSSYTFKATSLKLFQRYWANPSAGLPDAPGVFTRASRSDVEFFILDNRWYRDADRSVLTDKRMLGTAQMAWLRNALTQSRATWKVIINGSQMFNDLNRFEGWNHFPQERQAFVDWLTAQRVPGVLFLSGDRHFAAAFRVDRPGAYPLYEFTCSPLAANAWADPGQELIGNPTLIAGSVVGRNNFCQLDFSGRRGQRSLSVQIRDAQGQIAWSRAIAEQELR